MKLSGWCGAFIAGAVTVGCGSIAVPPEPPPSALLGCFRPAFSGAAAAYRDSLGDPFPETIQLTSRRVQEEVPLAYEVIPNSLDYPRHWTPEDRVWLSPYLFSPEGGTSPDEGPSADIYFPGPLGTLVLRVNTSDAGPATGIALWRTSVGVPARRIQGDVRLDPSSCAWGD